MPSPQLAPAGPRSPARPLTVALTGATGTLGPALLERLRRRPEVGELRVLSRRATADMPREADLRQVDVRDKAAVTDALEAVDVVVHMAFALYGVKPDEAALFATNVRGTANVGRAAVAAGARRFVYTSSAAVYGLRADNPQPLTEADPIRASARHFYSRHKAQCELIVAEALAPGDTDGYLFRPCAIVGPHAVGGIAGGLPPWAPRAAGAVMRGLARTGLRPALPPPPVPLQFVHEDDVAQAIERAVLGEGPPGTYNLAGEGAVAGQEALALLGLRVLPLPRTVVAGALRAFAAAPPVLPALSWPALLTEPILLDTRRARDELGWSPEYDSRAALLATRRALGW